MTTKKSRYYTGNSEPLRKALGIAFKQAREEKGLGQVDIAVAINRAQSFISEVENGERNITLEILCELSDELGVKLSDIFASAENNMQ